MRLIKINFIVIGLFFISILFIIIFGEPFVRSDSFYYYQTAKTLVEEGNFVTDKKPLHWDAAASWTKTIYKNNYVSVASPGNALFNIPPLFISKLLNNNVNYYNEYFIAYNGHTLFDGTFLLLNAFIFFWTSLFLIYKSLRLLNFSRRKSVFSIFAVTMSSYVLWYVYLLPSLYTYLRNFLFFSNNLFFIEK